MLPALEDGDYIVIKKPRRYASGFIYVIDHMDLGIIVKRLTEIDGEYLHFSGDNKASTPDALLGRVTKDRIIGRAVLRIGRGKIGRV